MTIHELPKSEWGSYFDQISRHLIGERILVEIKGLPFGDRRQARCLTLIGITYDWKDNILQVAMDGLDHLVHAPRKIIVTDGEEGLESMEVIDADQQSQIVTLVKPLRYRRRMTSGERPEHA